jgi:YegS/Rv2252/BmrU family lipid kinase
MTTGSKLWFVIINPTSGNGLGQKKWPIIKSLLEAHHFVFEFAFTEHPKHSIELVHQNLKRNIKNFICIGGDGTIHNIVNGIMLQKNVKSTEIHVGVIPIGTGNDWVKTHKIPKDFDVAIKIIKKGNTAIQDIGKIELKNGAKPPVFFNNLAGIGFDGYVVSKIDKYKQIGALAYLYGALIGLFSFKTFHSKVSVNSKEISGKTLMILIGLCQYSGGGMQLTHTSNPFDALLDITIAKDFNKFEIIKNVAKLFNGNITNHKKITVLKTSSISIEINQEFKPFIQADGELIGSGPFEVSIIPKAFSFYC